VVVEVCVARLKTESSVSVVASSTQAAAATEIPQVRVTSQAARVLIRLSVETSQNPAFEPQIGSNGNSA
jgi:hypothetical protein